MVPPKLTVTKSPFPKVTPLRYSDVPEVLSVQVVPSEEVRMVPPKLTVTKSPFPKVTPLRYSDVPEVLLVHEVPSGEVRMVPESPTVTNILIFSTTFVSF